MTKALGLKIKIIITLNFIMLAVHVINITGNGYITRFGIIPRSVDSLLNILMSPFIHGDIEHLFNNLIALSVFSALCLLRSVRFFFQSSLFIIIVGGGLVWLLGRSSSHIGASGWIFGLWSLSIAIAWFDRRLINILVAFTVLFLYGGMVYGVLPTDARVSFEAHLFGAISGVIFAFFMKKDNTKVNNTHYV